MELNGVHFFFRLRLFSLSIIILRCVYIAVCINSPLLFDAEYYSIGCIYHSLFTHSLVDGHFYLQFFHYYKSALTLGKKMQEVGIYVWMELELCCCD